MKNGDKITKSDYQKLSKIFEASGRDADEICGFIAKNADDINFKPEKLMDELIHSGKKFTLDKVEFVVKNSDGELMWLEYGDESKGLYHILYGSSKKAGHLDDFAKRGIKDVKSFDECSAYPYVMTTFKFPGTEFKKCNIKKLEDISSRFAYLLVVKFTNIRCKYYNTFISNIRSCCRA